ncbi:MAG: hypothetical protein KDD43_09020, partial [Bdellovibrionales bacterium]|nr:hypothetical protein [Bdellovibrionales bacterium]
APLGQVLILPHGGDQIDYQAFLHTEKMTLSLSEYLLEHWVSEADVANLNRHIRESFEQLKKHPGPVVLKEIQQNLTRAHDKNWPKKARDELAHLWLTAYALSPTEEKKSNLLMQLGKFHPLYSPPLERFSPPVIAAWKRVAGGIQNLSWQPGSAWSDFQYFIINGKVFDLESTGEVVLPSQDVHFTALSDRYQPIDRIIKGIHLIHWQPPKEILVSGTCEEPKWSPHLELDPRFRAFFSETCVKARTSEIQQPELKLTTNPQGNGFPQLGEPPRMAVSTERRIWPWFLLAGAIVGAISLDQMNKHNRPSNSPTYQPAQQPITHHGF